MQMNRGESGVGVLRQHCLKYWATNNSPTSALNVRGAVGSAFESLLRYHRPLAEDGSVEYDFHYSPNAIAEHTHPALDRLTFLLDPNGVRIHWMTDAPYDHANLPPDNAFDEPDNRRGPDQLPLKADDWNRMKVAISGSTVTLELNGQPIYERQLEANNRRSFGLFHFADQSQVRVRNVVMRGDWPKTLPSLPDQQLADLTVAELDADMARLTSEFTHDFGRDGMPDRFFKPLGPNSPAGLSTGTDGLHANIAAANKWSHVALSPRFVLRGDFDIEVRFDQLTMVEEKDGNVQLAVRIHDAQSHDARVMRIQNVTTRNYMAGQLSSSEDGKRRHQTSGVITNEASSGRLRMVRRDDTIYGLFTEGESSQYRLIIKLTASGQEVSLDGIQLIAVAARPGSQTTVVWKDIRLRAEKLLYLPPADASVLLSLHTLAVPDVKKIRDPDVPLWQQYCDLRMNQFALFAEDENGDEVPQLAEPVMFHKVSTYSHGRISLWTAANGRPVAIGTAIVQGRLSSSSFREIDEFHSLHSGPVRMTDGGKEVWNVATPGLTWSLIPDAPALASSATAEQLIAQAHKLAERFSIEMGERGQKGPPLQEKPIHEYTFKSEEALLGGILTAFTTESDPEVLLSLEVRPDTEGKLRWHYAAASYTASGTFLLLDEEPVWEESPARFGAKIPHLGWITDNVDLEDGLANFTPADIQTVTVPALPYKHLGSPEWSNDGKKIVIDISHGSTSSAHVMTVNADGSELMDLGTGCLPGFSPDATQVVFCVPGRGVYQVNSDGTERKQISGTGWGVQSSPDGRYIAWANGRNITLLNTKTDEQTQLLTDEQSATLGYVYWNFGWSHDGKSIAFKTRTRQNDADAVVAVADVDSSDGYKVVYTGAGINADFTWHPDGKRILFAIRLPEQKLSRMYTVNRDDNTPPQLIPDQPRDWQILDCDWSPDGKHIVFSAVVPPELSEWPPVEAVEQ
jgi:hypothetical protein